MTNEASLSDLLRAVGRRLTAHRYMHHITAPRVAAAGVLVCALQAYDTRKQMKRALRLLDSIETRAPPSWTTDRAYATISSISSSVEALNENVARLSRDTPSPVVGPLSGQKRTVTAAVNAE